MPEEVVTNLQPPSSQASRFHCQLHNSLHLTPPPLPRPRRDIQTALGKVVDEEQEATSRTETAVAQQRQDAEQSAPTMPPPAPPESNHPPPAEPPQAAATAADADATKKPDASSPRLTAGGGGGGGRPRVCAETLAFHAAVAAGDVPSVEVYIAQNADKILQSKAAAAAASQDDLYRKEDTTTGFAALLVVPGGLNSGDPGGGGGGALSPLEVVDLRGRTPLHTACVEGRAEVVRVLLRAGANASAFDSAG